MDISLKFENLNKMKIASSESKRKLKRSGKGLITSLGFKTKVRPQKYKMARYAIGNVSKKDIYKIIREFEKFEKLTYEKKRSKHKSTDSYVYLSNSLQNVWWDLIPSIGTIMAVIRKLLLRPWTFMLQTRTNKTHHRAQIFIAKFPREQWKIKTKYRQQNFIA